MKLNEQLNRWNKEVMNFFFPRRCPFCGAVVGRELVCAKCEKELPFTEGQALREGPYGQCAAPLYYEGAVREALLLYKFHGKTGGLDYFGSLMAQCAAEEYSGCFDTTL